MLTLSTIMKLGLVSNNYSFVCHHKCLTVHRTRPNQVRKSSEQTGLVQIYATASQY